MRLRFLIVLLCVSFASIQANAQVTKDPALVKQRVFLLSRRTALQDAIHGKEQQLHQLERDRNDKLEELEQLYTARRAMERYRFSKDISDEISIQTTELRTLERARSDCLEELDCLHLGLSKLNGDIADCDKALR